MIDEYVTTSIRLPRTLYDRVRAGAKANYRSLNQEIVCRLAVALKFQPVAETGSPDSMSADSGAQPVADAGIAESAIEATE